MSHIRWGLLSAMLLLAACKGGLPTQKPNTVRSKAPSVTPSLKPSPSGSVATLAVKSPDPSQAPERPMLLTQSESTIKVSGQLRIDAAYALALGGGRLLSDKGASAIALADASLISDAGGNVIANNSGSLISDRGGSLISNNAGNLISDGGGSLVSKVKYGLLSSFGLLQESPTTATDTLQPAAGMLVGVLSLTDGQALPIGVDTSGKPAYAIYSNAVGGYDFYLPAALQGNVRVVARPPALTADAVPDARMAYASLIRPRAEGAVNVDEDTTQVTLCLRSAIKRRILEFLQAEDINANVAEIVGKKSIPEFFKPLLLGFATEINSESKASGLQKASLAAQDYVAQRVVDLALRQIDLEGLQVDGATSQSWTEAPAPVVPTLINSIRKIRAAAAAALLKDPTFFEQQGYFQAINATRAPGDAYVIRKASDLSTVLVTEFLSQNIDTHGEVKAIFQSIGLTETHTLLRGTTSNLEQDRMSACTVAVANAMLTVLLQNENGCKDDTLALIRSYQPPTEASGQ